MMVAGAGGEGQREASDGNRHCNIVYYLAISAPLWGKHDDEYSIYSREY